jgi:drug/metabolite transporter (DMT)-like permease
VALANVGYVATVALPGSKAGTNARALGAVVVAVLGWSASSLFVRAAHANAVVFATWRLWFALPPLGAIVYANRRSRPGFRPRPEGMTRTGWILLVTGGGACFASGAATAFAAIALTRLLDVTLITSLQPVLIVAFAVVALRERVGRTQVALAVLAVVGTVVVAGAASGSGTWSLTGDLVAVLSLFLNAGWFVYGRVVRARYAVDPFEFLFGVLASAAVLMTPLALVSAGSLHLRAAALGFAACTMVSGTTAHILMIWAHGYVPASVSAPLLLAEAPIVALAAWACFGQALGPVEILGSAIVVAALFGMVRTPAIALVEDEAPDLAPPT